MSTANSLGVLSVIILVVLILFINYIKYGKFINDLFEPTTFFMIFILVFFGINYISKYEYYWMTILTVFLGSLFYIIGYYANIKVSIDKRTVKTVKLETSNVIYEIGVIRYLTRTILLSITNFVIKLIEIRSYGISFSAFFNNMMKFAAISKEGGYVWMALTYPIVVMNYINMISYLKSKNRKYAVIIIGQIIFCIGLLSTSRFNYIINAVFIPLILKQVYIDKKPSFKKYYLIILVSILPIMIILNFIRHGQFELISFDFYSLLQNTMDSLRGDTNPGQKLDALIRYLNQTNNYNYGKYFIYQVISVVPRKIWKSKPITSFCFQYTVDVFKKDPIIGGTTYTFTIFDTYSVGGILACCLLTMLFGMISRFLYENMYNGSLFVQIFSFVVITNYINVLRGSWMDMISIYILYIVINTLFYMYYKNIKRRRLIFRFGSKNVTV